MRYIKCEECLYAFRPHGRDNACVHETYVFIFDFFEQAPGFRLNCRRYMYDTSGGVGI